MLQGRGSRAESARRKSCAGRSTYIPWRGESAEKSQRRERNPASIEALMSREARRYKIRGNSQKSLNRNHEAVEALMVHVHIPAARRADLMRQIETAGRAIYALQTDPAQLSST
jgi:hypothetical protein